jgi:hypothetical protein
MAEPVRHRQTKEAATDMFDLQLPRHTSTLPKPVLSIGLHTRWTSCAESLLEDMVGNAQRLGGDGQRRIHRRRGRKEGCIHHEQVGVIMRAAKHIERRGRRIGAHSHGAALMRGGAAVEWAGEHNRIAGRPEHIARLGNQASVRSDVCALPMQDDVGAVDGHAVVGMRQILAHQIPVDGMAREPTQCRLRNKRQIDFEDRRRNLVEQLHVAHWFAAGAIAEIEVVQPDGLLINGVVVMAWIDGKQGSAVVGS